MLIPIQGNEGRDPVTIDCATQQHTPDIYWPDVGLTLTVRGPTLVDRIGRLWTSDSDD